MILQTKPTQWTCIATSFAMALGLSVEEMFALIGHDGGELAFHHLPEPACRRGHHIQECINVAVNLGYCVTPIELIPQIESTDGMKALKVLYGPEGHQNFWHFKSTIQNSSGVITGNGKNCGHAVAYDRGSIFDPDGRLYAYSIAATKARHFYPLCAWRIDRRETRSAR